jgi:Chromo (CHRromatin Organisation MOdifier) domain
MQASKKETKPISVCKITDTGRNHKLESLVQGSYEVVENAGETLRLRIQDETVRVSSDLVTRAPSRVYGPEPSPRPETSSPSEDLLTPQSRSGTRRVRFANDPTVMGEFVVDRIVDAAMNEGGQVMYRIRWMGYQEEEDTWQEEVTIPKQFIRGYWKAKGLTTLQGEHTLF